MPGRLASRARSALIFTLKLAISAALLALVLRDTDLPALVDRLGRLDPIWVSGAASAYGIMLAVSTWRWRVLLRAQRIDVPARRLWSSFWVATFFNNFLPSNIGGDVVRIADTAKPAGSKTLATTIVLIDRGLGLAALLAVAAVGSLASAAAGLRVPGERWIWLAGAGSVAAAVPAIAAPQAAAHLLAPLRFLRRPWIAERVGRLDDALAQFGAHRSALAGAFLGAFVVQAVLVAFYVMTARAMAIPLPIVAAAALVPVSLAVQMVPVSINGFGVREAVFALFFSRFGLPADAAVALSLAATAIILLLSLAGGVVFLTRRHTAHASEAM